MFYYLKNGQSLHKTLPIGVYLNFRQVANIQAHSKLQVPIFVCFSSLSLLLVNRCSIPGNADPAPHGLLRIASEGGAPFGNIGFYGWVGLTPHGNRNLSGVGVSPHDHSGLPGGRGAVALVLD